MFSHLKVGDKVIVAERGKETVYEVEKVTPGGNIKVNGLLYNYKNGKIKISDPYAVSCLKLYTPNSKE